MALIRNSPGPIKGNIMTATMTGGQTGILYIVYYHKSERPDKRRRKGPDPEQVALYHMKKETWQMLPLEELTRLTWSLTRKIGMFTLRVYLLAAVIFLVVKMVQLATGH
jgi:hypothetical protein